MEERGRAGEKERGGREIGRGREREGERGRRERERERGRERKRKGCRKRV